MSDNTYEISLIPESMGWMLGVAACIMALGYAYKLEAEVDLLKYELQQKKDAKYERAAK